MDNKVELEVINISSSQAQASAYAMLLHEVGGERQLPIIIGSAEAQSIAFKLNNVKPIRPLTHDLFANTLGVFDIQLKEVLIYKAKEGVFYSYLLFQGSDKTLQVDSRTSDAIALAMRLNAPIYILESVLDKECIILNDDDLQPRSSDASSTSSKDDISKQDIQALKKALTKAVEEENYELASILRDEIARRQ